MDQSPRCLYNSDIERFCAADENSIFGALSDHKHGDSLTTTREAWKNEISIMKAVLTSYESGQIIFE